MTIQLEPRLYTMYVCMYIYIYIEREREIYIGLFMDWLYVTLGWSGRRRAARAARDSGGSAEQGGLR